MTANTAEHDTLAYRLTQILVKFNQGEKLDPQALADEFGVNLRTIQRDLNERFAYLPLEKANGRYHLNPAYLGKLNLRDVERFAALAGVRGLFPCQTIFCATSSTAACRPRCWSRAPTTKTWAAGKAASGSWSRRFWRTTPSPLTT